MPLFWKYLLKNYLKVFFLSIFVFIVMLLLTRTKEIARFYALSDSIKDVYLFICLQIPHILPWAIPISCFISAYLLFQSFSQTSELTAMRAFGISIKGLITPLLFASLVISSINFYILSEISFASYFKSRKLLIEKTSVNPIQLLKRQKLLKIKDSFVTFQNKDPDTAQNLLWIMNHKNRLALFSAKELCLDKEKIIGKNTAFLFSLKEDKDPLSHLIIENHQSIISSANDLSNLMKKSRWSFYPSAMPLRLLKIHKQNHPAEKTNLSYELLKRSSIALTSLVFTLTGIAFGIHIKKTRAKKKILYPIFLLSLIILAHLSAKQLKTHLITSFCIYFIPQLLVIGINIRELNKLQKGQSC